MKLRRWSQDPITWAASVGVAGVEHQQLHPGVFEHRIDGVENLASLCFVSRRPRVAASL